MRAEIELEKLQKSRSYQIDICPKENRARHLKRVLFSFVKARWYSIPILQLHIHVQTKDVYRISFTVERKVRV